MKPLSRRLDVVPSVHLGTQMCLSYPVRMPANTSVEIGIRDLRTKLSDVVNDTAVYGQITYVTSRGRRVAAIVPVPDAEAIEAKKQPEGGDPPA